MWYVRKYPMRPHCIFSPRTWRKYPMRPGLGRSLSPPRRLGGWGDPLGTISKWGRASSHDGDNRASTSPLERCCFFLPRCPQASTGLCRGRAARVRASRMFGLRTARLQEHRHHVHLTISLTQSRQLDRPAHGIGR